MSPVSSGNYQRSYILPIPHDQVNKLAALVVATVPDSNLVGSSKVLLHYGNQPCVISLQALSHSSRSKLSPRKVMIDGAKDVIIKSNLEYLSGWIAGSDLRLK